MRRFRMVLLIIAFVAFGVTIGNRCVSGVLCTGVVFASTGGGQSGDSTGGSTGTVTAGSQPLPTGKLTVTKLLSILIATTIGIGTGTSTSQ